MWNHKSHPAVIIFSTGCGRRRFQNRSSVNYDVKAIAVSGSGVIGRTASSACGSAVLQPPFHCGRCGVMNSPFMHQPAVAAVDELPAAIRALHKTFLDFPVHAVARHQSALDGTEAVLFHPSATRANRTVGACLRRSLAQAMPAIIANLHAA